MVSIYPKLRLISFSNLPSVPSLIFLELLSSQPSNSPLLLFSYIQLLAKSHSLGLCASSIHILPIPSCHGPDSGSYKFVRLISPLHPILHTAYTPCRFLSNASPHLHQILLETSMPLDWWFSHCSIHRNPPKGLLKHRLMGHTPKFLIQ